MQLIFEIKQSLLAGQGEFIQERDGMSNKMIYEGDRSLLIDWWYLEHKHLKSAPYIAPIIVEHCQIRPITYARTRNVKISSIPLHNL